MSVDEDEDDDDESDDDEDDNMGSNGTPDLTSLLEADESKRENGIFVVYLNTKTLLTHFRLHKLRSYMHCKVYFVCSMGFNMNRKKN